VIRSIDRGVELWSLAANERAIRSYERCGFRTDATLPERSFKDGKWHDRVIMSVTHGAFKALQRNGV